ncbi:MAG TPA: 30S ribosomal protein S5 [Candidatus Paceibacterota bacterium]
MTTTMTETMEKVPAAAEGTSAPRGRGMAAGASRPASSVRERRGRAPREGRGRVERARSEFDQVTLEVRRVARVMAGGRRFSFSVTVVIGDRKGRVGVGIGKGADTALAVEKAVRDARKHLVSIVRTEGNSIPHTVEAKYASSVVMIVPSAGRGIVTGSAMRTVLELAGVNDVVGKILSRSKNKLTIARATVAALTKLAPKQAKAKAAPPVAA